MSSFSENYLPKICFPRQDILSKSCMKIIIGRAIMPYNLKTTIIIMEKY